MARNTSFDYWSVQIINLPASITEDQLAQRFHIPKERIKISPNQKFSTYCAWINDFVSEREAKDFVRQWTDSSVFGKNIKCKAFEPKNGNTAIPSASSVLPKPIVGTDPRRTPPQGSHPSPTREPFENQVEGKRPLCPWANKGTCSKGSSDCKYRHQRCPNFEVCSSSNCDLAHAKRDVTPKPYPFTSDPKTNEQDPRIRYSIGQTEPRIDMKSNATEINVWVRFEGGEATKRILSSTSDIDDLKKAALEGQGGSYLYQARYRNRVLEPAEQVPSKTTSDQPVVLIKMNKSQSTESRDASPMPDVNRITLSSSPPNDQPLILTDYHIIIDYSNVFFGSWKMRTKVTGLIETNPAVRINVNSLAKVLEANKLPIWIKTRIIGGSKPPPENAPPWTEWKLRGYTCILGDRSAKGPEVFVDDMLHAQILSVHNTYKDILNRRQVLVLVTGDGNRNYGHTSFPNIVQTVLLNNNWSVELWSWKQSLNEVYFEIQKFFPTRMTIKYFDSYREDFTYENKFREN